MTAKSALLSAFSRTDNPRRETLRTELAKSAARDKDTAPRPKLVLASASPRRLMLLDQAGIKPDALRPASIDETPRKGELPRALVARLARAKAEAARDQIANDRDIADAYVLAADTIVDCDAKLESGTGFLVDAHENVDRAFLGGVQRAIAAFGLTREGGGSAFRAAGYRAMLADHGWDRPARLHERLYRSLTGSNAAMPAGMTASAERT